VTMQYMLLFSHRKVALPAARQTHTQTNVVDVGRTAATSRPDASAESRRRGTVRQVRRAPSVVLSQKHDVAVCNPAPFFCINTAVTAHADHRRSP
jgi:hypothetical protein